MTHFISARDFGLCNRCNTDIAQPQTTAMSDAAIAAPQTTRADASVLPTSLEPVIRLAPSPQNTAEQLCATCASATTTPAEALSKLLARADQIDGGETGNTETPQKQRTVCFTPGARIATPQGARAIETLSVGDSVVTRDRGLQKIRWIQSRTLDAIGQFAPIRIRPGAVTGLERDLLVSPQHRMLFTGRRAELLFGEREVLMPAAHLVDNKLVSREAGGKVTYIHMMFDQHEIVYAEGAATESFHPGDEGLDGITGAARAELFAIFPELRSDPSVYGGTARRCLAQRETEMLHS